MPAGLRVTTFPAFDMRPFYTRLSHHRGPFDFVACPAGEVSIRRCFATHFASPL